VKDFQFESELCCTEAGRLMYGSEKVRAGIAPLGKEKTG